MGIEGISATERPRRDVDWGWNAPAGCRCQRRGRRGRRGREFEQGHRQRGRHGCRRSAQRDARQPGGFGVALAPRAARRRRRNQRTLGRGRFDRCVHALAPRDGRADPRAAFRDRLVAPSRKHVGFSRSGFSLFSRVRTGRFFLVDTPMPGDFRLTTLPSPPPLPLVEQAYSRRTCTASSPGRLRTSPRSQSASFEATSSRWATTNGA